MKKVPTKTRSLLEPFHFRLAEQHSSSPRRLFFGDRATFKHQQKTVLYYRRLSTPLCFTPSLFQSASFLPSTNILHVFSLLAVRSAGKIHPEKMFFFRKKKTQLFQNQRGSEHITTIVGTNNSNNDYYYFTLRPIEPRGVPRKIARYDHQ